MRSVTLKGVVSAFAWLALFLTATVASAQGGGGGGGDIAAMATTVKTQATAIATLLNVAAYVAGVGFALAGILQFKAHKENPQQTPLSKPIVMIVVAACLLFLPTVMNLAGSSLFGGSGQQALSYTPGK
jgi:intracellular multiplication protein IcmD